MNKKEREKKCKEKYAVFSTLHTKRLREKREKERECKWPTYQSINSFPQNNRKSQAKENVCMNEWIKGECPQKHADIQKKKKKKDTKKQKKKKKKKKWKIPKTRRKQNKKLQVKQSQTSLASHSSSSSLRVFIMGEKRKQNKNVWKFEARPAKK